MAMRRCVVFWTTCGVALRRGEWSRNPACRKPCRRPPDAPPLLLRQIRHRQNGCIAFRRAVGRRHHRRRDRTVAILHRGVDQVGELGFLAIGFLVKASIQSRPRLVRGIAPLLVMEIAASGPPGLTAAEHTGWA